MVVLRYILKSRILQTEQYLRKPNDFYTLKSRFRNLLKMNERVKLIWDFRGPNAKRIAEHHAKHLAEFAETEALKFSVSGQEEVTPMHHTAFLVVEKQLMDTMRDTLKPTRGQIYEAD